MVVVNPNCNALDGEIEIFFNGGVQPLTLDWFNPALAAANPQLGLGAGIYQVEVTQGNGCIDTLTIPLSNTNGPDVVITATNISCFNDANGELLGTSSGGTLPYTTEEWLDAGLNTLPNPATGLGAGLYTFHVVDVIGVEDIVGEEVLSIRIARPPSTKSSLSCILSICSCKPSTLA